MSNHFHLLLHAKDDTVGNIVKRIASSYVYYFNKKYGRDGHLFKERFRSEPCEDWSYFVTLLRYIHQNPIKAGLVRQVSDYEYTSWHEYLGKAVFFPLCNVPTVLRRISMKELSELVETPLGENISCLEYEDERNRSMSDDQVMLYLFEEFGISDGQQLQRLDKEQRNDILSALLSRRAGIRQLQRLTGIGKNSISNISKTIVKQSGHTCPSVLVLGR